MSTNQVQELSLDLGYRWESGEMDSMEVLIELCGSKSAAMLMINRDTEDMLDAHRAWKKAGDTFDWCLGVGKPNCDMHHVLLEHWVNPHTA